MAGPLAEMVRAKYPGAYDDMPDEELEASITAKFPGVYDDLTEAPPEAAPRSVLDTALQYSGLKGLGKLVYGDEGGNLPAAGATVGGLVGGVPGAAVGGAGGTLARDLIRANAGDPRTPRTALGAATEVGKNAAIQGGIQKIGAVIPGKLIGAGRKLYQGALKPTQALAGKTKGGADALVETGLREGITVSKGGLRKVDRTVDALDDEVQKAIAGSSAMVDPRKVMRGIRPVVQEFSEQVNPGADLRAIGEEGRAFMKGRGANLIPVEKAQALKSGTYRRLRNDYGKVSAPTAEAQKGLASGLREEIASAVPEVAPLNARMGPLIDLEKALARTRVGNTDAVSLRDVVAMSGGNKAAILASLLQRAPAQSMLGRGAYRTGQAVDPDMLANAIRVMLESGTDGAPPEEP